ncbi:MAG: hypothetical protein ABFS14_06710 [Gemmatimonadota bacterium]
MGLFPAALTLAENGFDLPELLRAPDYRAGGPNTHSTSPVTLGTAIVLTLSGGGAKSMLILHLLHFIVAACALVTFFRFARPVLGGTATLLLCLSVLLHPLFLVQVGYMYLEVALFLCAVSALLAWVRGRFWPAVIWAALAFAIKETGILVPATLITAVLIENRRFVVRLRRATQIASLPALWWGSMALLEATAQSGNPEGLELFPPFVFQSLLHYLDRFLFNVPDLLVFLIIFLIAAIAAGPGMSRVLRQEPTTPAARGAEQQARLPLALSGVLIVGFLLLFLVALPLAARFTIVLPRYYVIILPFLLLWVGYAARTLARRLGGRVKRPAVVTFVLLSLFFALNHGGQFYPLDVHTEGPGNDFPLTERSHAYIRLNAIQKEAVAYLETLPNGTPVYYGHFEHYLFSYPGLGYASGPLLNGHNLTLESVPDLVSGPDPPTCLYVLYNYPWLGGSFIRRLFQLADAETDLAREVVREFRDGRYSISLTRIRHVDSTCPA